MPRSNAVVYLHLMLIILDAAFAAETRTQKAKKRRKVNKYSWKPLKIEDPLLITYQRIREALTMGEVYLKNSTLCYTDDRICSIKYDTPMDVIKTQVWYRNDSYSVSGPPKFRNDSNGHESIVILHNYGPDLTFRLLYTDYRSCLVLRSVPPWYSPVKPACHLYTRGMLTNYRNNNWCEFNYKILCGVPNSNFKRVEDCEPWRQYTTPKP